MTMKNTKPQKGRKHRPIKCEGCKTLIDVDYALSVEDFEYTDSSKSKIYLYCPSCGLEHIYKLY